MPRRRRPDLGRRSQSNVRRATSRANRSDDQRQTDQENSRIAMSDLRSLVSDNVGDRLRMQRVRAHQTQQQQDRHNEIERIRRRNAPVILERAAFHYDPAIDYCADKSVTIGEMKTICKYCKALKYTGESTGLCCAEGKVKLPQLVPPPDPLRSLVSGIGSDSKHFLTNIQKYNNCFQMTSFGATHIIQDNFMPTFKDRKMFNNRKVKETSSAITLKLRIKQRYEQIKNDPERLKILTEKRRAYYQKRKKPIVEKSPLLQCEQRKRWKENTRRYRQRKKERLNKDETETVQVEVNFSDDMADKNIIGSEKNMNGTEKTNSNETATNGVGTIEILTNAVETIEIPEQDDDDTTADGPLRLLLQRLIQNDTAQNTILTNVQLIEILKKQFDRDVYMMHSLEVDMYMNIMKKFLKEWPQWDEFDAVISNLKNNDDQEGIKKVIDDKYNDLTQYLKSMIDLAKPMIDEAVKDVKEEEPMTLLDTDTVVMEVVCTREQLNQLIYRRPKSDVSTSVFNIENSLQSRIHLDTWNLTSILHMWNVKVSINLNFLTYKREMLHTLKHILLNKKHTLTHPIGTLNRDFQMKPTRPKDFLRNQLIEAFQTLLSMHIDGDNYDLLNEVFTVLKSDFDEAPDVLNVPARYRRYMNKYLYLRNLYTENSDRVSDKFSKAYDLQLEETVMPMFQISISKFEITEIELPSFDDWFQIECGYCKVKFYGDDLLERLKTHFNENHQSEPEWMCSHCLGKFTMKQLTELKWFHSC